jgi:hypothetical protein
MGLGSYNFNTAVADSINVDTAIKWNEYVWNVLKNENREAAERRIRQYTRHQEQWKKYEERLRNSPQERDVMNGDALNVSLEELSAPEVYDSYFHSNPVPLTADMIRRIPFMLGIKGARFSMERLAKKGRSKWPIALQNEQFAPERKAYERAFDNALELQIEGKIQTEDIRAVQQAVDDLYQKLDRVMKATDEPLWQEAFRYLGELRTYSKYLQYHQIEQVMGQIERYGGTTVYELKAFMQKNNLRFAAAETREERELYPKLYAALMEQREILKGSPREPKR